MRFNRVKLDEPPRPRGRTPFPPALGPAPPPPVEIPIPPARLKRVTREDELLQFTARLAYPAALFAPPAPPAALPIPPRRLKRTLRFDEEFIRKKGAGAYPLALHPTAPPQSITGTASLQITVEPGTNGSFSSGIAGQYGLGIQLTFGKGALWYRPFTLFIDSVDQTDLLLTNKLQINMQVSQVTTAMFELWDSTGNPANIPQVGQEVVIYSKNVRVFGGYVTKPAQGQFMALTGSMFSSATGGGSTSGQGSVSCADFSSILDRRYIGKYYSQFLGGSLQAIVNDIVQNYLSADGFTYDTIDGDPGVNLGNQLFDWVTIRAAFNTLSSLTGWDFNVDFSKVIRFFPAGARLGPAAFNIADNDGHTLAESMILTHDSTAYFNKVGIKSASGNGSLWCDTFSAAQPGPYISSPQPPDGVRRVFFTLYPINATPTVTVNSNPQVVASILDIAAGTAPANWQWAWDPPQGAVTTGGDFVEQRTSQPVLTASDVLVVCYATQLSPITWVQNDSQILARAAVEGNSGIYETVINAPSTMTDPAAQTLYAEALLARYSSSGVPYTVTYMTDDDGLFVGYSQAVQQTTPPVSLPNGLIQQVQMRDVDKTFFRYTVTVASGEYLARDAAQFFAALIAGIQQPQPANRNTYQWQIAPSYPGITNPGVTGGFVSPQVEVVKNGVEQLLIMTVYLKNTLEGAAAHFGLNLNSSGIASVDIQPGQSGVFTVFAANAQFARGQVMQIEIDGTFAAIKDAVVTVQTAVLVN